MPETPQQPIEFIPPSIEHLAELLPAYQFESLVAKGGMGAVYKATQTSLDRTVAIKVLPPELGKSTEFRDSFEKEAKLMARLNHPNLIAVYDFGEIEGMLYIVMEFVDGATLYEKTYEGHLETEEALEVTIAICNGLANAHEAGILHRDIKPANIFITDNGTPKIGDFGLARPSGGQETGVIFGTPGYTSPEVLDAPDKVGPVTDVFAVGVILYELLTGNTPSSEVYQSVSKFTQCDPALDKMVRKAIANDFRQRYQTAAELSEDLSELARKLKKAPASTPTKSPFATGTPNSTPAGQIKAASRPPASSPKKINATKGGGPGLKNFFIILLLLAGIYGALEWKKKREAQIAEIEASQTGTEAAAKPDKKKNKVSLKNLSVEETLELLKPRLLAGERPLKSMPKGIVKHDNGSRIVLLINKKLTWQQADKWTQQFGGHLATVVSRDDLKSFQQAIPVGEKVWVGAATSGNKQWSWLDGSDWNGAIHIRKTSKLAFAQIDRDLFASAKSYNDRARFLIEWKLDGSRPAAIEERLKRVTATLKNATPAYPPGSVTFGKRAYYLCPIPLTLDEANKLSKSGGAHLAVPSNDVENIYINELIPSNIPPNNLCRIGGVLKGFEWMWLSGETWKFTAWDSNSPGENDSLVISSNSSGKWRSSPSSEKVAYTLFEWSKDSKVTKPARSSAVAKFTSLQVKASELINAAITARDATYIDNIERLKNDLDAELKKLPKNEKARQTTSVNEIKAALDGVTKLDQKISSMGSKSSITNLTEKAYERQERLSSQFNKKVDKIRTAYLSNVRNLIKILEARKQTTAAKVAKDSMDAAKESTSEFINLFQ